MCRSNVKSAAYGLYGSVEAMPQIKPRPLSPGELAYNRRLEAWAAEHAEQLSRPSRGTMVHKPSMTRYGSVLSQGEWKPENV